MGAHHDGEAAAHAVRGRGLGEAGPPGVAGEIGNVDRPAPGGGLDARAPAGGGLDRVELVGDRVAGGPGLEGAAARQGDAHVVGPGDDRTDRPGRRPQGPVDDVVVVDHLPGQVVGTRQQCLAHLRHVVTHLGDLRDTC